MPAPERQHRELAARSFKRATDVTTRGRTVTQARALFCYYVAYGDSLEDSYRRAYPRDQSALRSPAAALKRAKLLLAEAPIQEQIYQVTEDIMAAARLTPEQHMSALRRIRDRAEEAGQFPTALRAEELRGRAAGFYVERHLITHADLSEAEIMQRLRALVEANPDVADALGQAMPAGVLGPGPAPEIVSEQDGPETASPAPHQVNENPASEQV